MKGAGPLHKVLFVCHGNICRSPMAEIILRDMVTRRGIEKEFQIASCATSTEEIWGGIGNPVYPPAREELRKHGLSAGDKRAVQLKKADYDAYDVLFAMDRQNIRNILRLLGGDPEGKVKLFLGDREVDDPWYTGRFSEVFRQLAEGSEAYLRELGY